MKRFALKSLLKKHGKKALILYMCWCVIKGLVFLYAGLQLLS